MLRMPGTPASAAYADESYEMTKKGQLDLCMGVNLVFSVLGGIFGVVILIVLAPVLAEVAINFSSFEYFWLACLGLTCAVFIGTGDPLKGLLSLFIGLAIGCIGIDPAAGQPRFTFGNVDLLSGINFIPTLIGMFAVSELLRGAVTMEKGGAVVAQAVGSLMTGVGGVFRKYWFNFLRGSTIGTVIGALPGAGGRHRGLGFLCGLQEDVQGAGEVRNRPYRGHRRLDLRQQLRAGRRLDSGARLRHSGRFDHGHRDRRALHEGDESGAERVPADAGTDLCRLHHLHSRQFDHVPARLGGDQIG